MCQTGGGDWILLGFRRSGCEEGQTIQLIRTFEAFYIEKHVWQDCYIEATSKKCDLKYSRFFIYQNKAIQPSETPLHGHHCAEKQRFRYNRT